MSTATVDLTELVLYTPEQAAEIMSGSIPGLVTARSLRDGMRRGDYEYTKVGRRVLLSRPQIAAILAAMRVPATARSSRRRTTAA